MSAQYFITAFLSGAAVMVAEISAARAIAPHFGASVVVWTNVIGIILIALALGYWMGGRIVERRADARLLGAIMTAAGILLILPAFATPFIAGSLIGELLRAGSGFLVLLIGSLVSVVLLFALPIFLLGMVSPFLVKLATDGRTDIGAVAGRLYAISTIGSLVGTFLPTLLLLPLLGIRATILSAAVVLVVLGAVLMRRRSVVMLVVVPLALLTMRALPPPWFLGGRVVAAAESRYQYLRIIDHGDERLLAFNEGFGVQSVAVADGHVPEGYFSTIAALPAVFADDSRRIRVLILGNAGGTIGNLMQRFFPNRTLDITGVELDPAVTALTGTWFPPPPRPYPVIHADSRAFVRESNEQYDIIVVDAYTNQLTIPPHLASVEFFRLLRSRLSPDGLIVANVNAPHRNSRLLHTFEQTVAAAFPSVIVGSPGAWNYLLIAGEHAMLPVVRAVIGDRAVFTDVAVEINASGKRMFTDDWAPLEMFTDIELFDAIRAL